MVLEEGVIKGCEIFGNIMKYLNMIVSFNFGNVFLVLVVSVFIFFLLMLVIYLLLQNLMYDIFQLLLLWDKMDKEFFVKLCKWDLKNIGCFMVWIGLILLIFDIIIYVLMWFVFVVNSLEMQLLFQFGWFIEGLFLQILVVYMLCIQKIFFIQSIVVLLVMLMIGLVMVLGIYVLFLLLGVMVGLQLLLWEYFFWLVGMLFCYCVIVQIMKIFYICCFGQWF